MSLDLKNNNITKMLRFFFDRTSFKYKLKAFLDQKNTFEIKITNYFDKRYKRTFNSFIFNASLN